MISCVDVFCGVGGLTHGLKKGGVNVAAGVDIDPECRFAYEANNATPFKEIDIRKLGGDELRKMWVDGSIRLLAGCAPCQPFSTYSRHGRHQRGDTKWDLVSDFGRLVREAEPDLLTMENVPRLVDHEVFAQLLSALKGYRVWSTIVHCDQYGVPQTRKRLVLLASKFGKVSLPPPLIDEETPTVRRAIADLKTLSAGEADPEDPLHSACTLSPLSLRRIRASTPGGTWRDWPEDLRASCHVKKSGDTYPSVYGRMEWDAPAPTITTQSFGYGNGRFGHPEQHRAITLREAAILQTFPASYKFVRPNERVRYSVLGRLIGNAVPVKIGELIAQSFLGHLQDKGKGS
jgi:DNA (cytosine-5)-methyltransferase 1